MTATQFGRGGQTRRLAAVNAFEFPTGARYRFEVRHGGVDADGVKLVVAATRQWFRVLARLPRERLGMPSVAVEDMWQELARHEAEYDALCTAAFGHFVPCGPGARDGDVGGIDRIGPLLATLRLARRDDDAERDPLPLLFRVDREARVADGHGYLADCGGRGTCFPVKGLLCLKHAAGLDDGSSPWRINQFRVRSESRGTSTSTTFYGIGSTGGG